MTVAQTAASFHDIGIHDWLVKSLSQVSIFRPNAVQQNCIPPILQGSTPTLGGKPVRMKPSSSGW